MIKTVPSILVFIFVAILSASEGEGRNGNSETGSKNAVDEPLQESLDFLDLTGDVTPGLIQMDNLSRPRDASDAASKFRGTVSFSETIMKTRFAENGHYITGRSIFPGFSIELLSHGSEIIPVQKGIISTWQKGTSFWDVVVGAGRTWNQPDDQGWDRASIPVSLVSRLVGQVRNCITVFLYNQAEVSKSYIQCSQETSPVDKYQPGNMRVLVDTKFTDHFTADANQVVDAYQQSHAKALVVNDWSAIDDDGSIRQLFNRDANPEHEQSLAALIVDNEIYVQTPQTRHGAYPYLKDMRHGVYSVSKSLIGAVSLLYFAQRYGDDIFSALITDYVPGLADHPGWQAVTFSDAINMVTGTEGEDNGRYIARFIRSESADGGIAAIAMLGDSEPNPGEVFRYASTHTFVLSYAIQKYVEKREGEGSDYWDLVEQNVLKPIGVDHLAVQRTMEHDGSPGIPVLAWGAFPTLDETSKIARLYANYGAYDGQQILHRWRTQQALNRTSWLGYDATFKRKYQHSFWLQTHSTSKCTFQVSTMIGHGANYVAILPSGVIIIRYMDQNDYKLDPMVQAAEKIRSSC